MELKQSVCFSLTKAGEPTLNNQVKTSPFFLCFYDSKEIKCIGAAFFPLLQRSANCIKQEMAH